MKVAETICVLAASAMLLVPGARLAHGQTSAQTTTQSTPPGAAAINLPRLGDAAADELSPGTERRVGETIMRDLRREQVLLDDVELNDYLNRFGAQLTDTPPAQGFSFEFFLVKDASLNAFAMPGGFIGVHTG